MIRLKLLFSLLFCIGLLPAQGLVINELLSSGNIDYSDEDGDYPDWIELFNAGSVPISLQGAGLSDDFSDPYKWIFPDITILPGQYLVVFASGKDRFTELLSWDTVVDWGEAWHYSYNAGEPAANWMDPDFDSGSWLSGPSGFGYGDGDDATILDPTIAAYLRIDFSLPHLGQVNNAVLHVDYDDAFVAYLNGTEIARANIGTPGQPPPYDQGSDTWVEAQIYQGGSPALFTLTDPVIGILDTINTLAIQVHNHNIGSSDLTLIPFFSVGYSGPPHDSLYVNDLLGLVNGTVHTNFRLSSGGEELILTSATGSVIDSLTFPAIPRGISYGRVPDNPGVWRLYPEPSPGGINDSIGYTGFASEPGFNLPAGNYSGSQYIMLTAGTGEDIYFTIDGSDPADQGMLYQSGITVSTTSVVRAQTRAAGYLPSRTVTNTYLIDESTDLPVVSLSTNPEHFWDPDSGIYVPGPNAESNFPYFGANFWQDWERPVHIELFESGTDERFSADAGVKIFGNWSRGHPQKSLALYARDQYGYPEFNHRFFPELPLASFEAVVLRNSGNDWGVTMFRDVLMTGLVSDTDLDRQASRPVAVFINGQYMGLHNLREKVNEHFLAAHHNIDPDELVILENNAIPVQGTADQYQALMNYIGSHDLSTTAAYDYVRQRIDIDNYLTYQATQIYIDNTDWPGNNVKFWQSGLLDNRWRWILFDTDFGFGLFDPGAFQNNTLQFALDPYGPDWPNPPWSTLLFRKLMENQDFRQSYILRSCDLLNSNFLVSEVFQAIDDHHDRINGEMAHHFTRWGGSQAAWENNMTTLEDFALYRPVHARQHMQAYFSLSTPVMIVVDVYPRHAGRLQVNSLNINEYPWQGVYFPDLVIPVEVQPSLGYRFDRWENLVGDIGTTINFVPGMVDTLRAILVPDSTLITMVVINEINYNSADDSEAGDWVELFNPGSQSLDLTGWKFSDSNDGHIYYFPAGTELPAGGYLVLYSDSTLFHSIHGNSIQGLGELGFAFSGSGELLRLIDPSSTIIDSLTYDDAPPWPIGADGWGPTLELVNPLLDNSTGDNWATSIGLGTPGAQNDSYLPLKTVDEPVFARSFSLGQNYPNPFNSRTVIPISLSKAGLVNMDIYDLRGRHVKTLLREYTAAGYQRVNWNGCDESGIPVSSGIYLYRLQTGGKATTRKLLVVK